MQTRTLGKRKPQTIAEAHSELHKSLGDLLFEVCKALGILWLVGKISWLEPRDWVKRRLNSQPLKQSKEEDK